MTIVVDVMVHNFSAILETLDIFEVIVKFHQENISVGFIPP